MSRERELLARAAFIGGVPRSGTTFLARSLNRHPDFLVSADDHVLESWGLYYYRSRAGIVDGLRRGTMTGEEALAALARHHFRDGRLLRAVPSDKTAGLEPSAPPARPDGEVLEEDADLERYDVPLAAISGGRRLCLKSPEITYVLGDLAGLLPEARFILVYRPLAEVAESMYRMGERVKKVKIFHRRWHDEKGADGRLAPPPGVPAEWADLWHEVTDFQRCVMNGGSYLLALSAQLGKLPRKQRFTVNLKVLRQDPGSLFRSLARFLKVREHGFQEGIEGARRTDPLPADPLLIREYDALCRRLEATGLAADEGVGDFLEDA